MALDTLPPERSPSMIEKMKFRRRSDTQSIKKPKETTQANMSANIESTPYSSGDWTDVIVTCKTHTWRLHKEILMSKCDYFRDRCLAEQNRQPGVRSSHLQAYQYTNMSSNQSQLQSKMKTHKSSKLSYATSTPETSTGQTPTVSSIHTISTPWSSKWLSSSSFRDSPCSH
jgi:hypothetical protein